MTTRQTFRVTSSEMLGSGLPGDAAVLGHCHDQSPEPRGGAVTTWSGPRPSTARAWPAHVRADQRGAVAARARGVRRLDAEADARLRAGPARLRLPGRFRGQPERARRASRHARAALRWLPDGAEPGRGRRCGCAPRRSCRGLRARRRRGVTRDGSGRSCDAPQSRSPWRAPVRLDHVNARTARLTAALATGRVNWGSRLRAPDRRRRAGPTRLLRRAPFSHDMAIGRDTRTGFHHVAYAMRDTAALIGSPTRSPTPAARDRVGRAGTASPTPVPLRARSRR